MNILEGIVDMKELVNLNNINYVYVYKFRIVEYGWLLFKIRIFLLWFIFEKINNEIII